MFPNYNNVINNNRTILSSKTIKDREVLYINSNVD